MDLLESLRELSAILKAEGIPHALIGALAMAERGYLRATQDIDLIIAEENIRRTRELLTGRGYSVFHETDNVLQLSGSVAVEILIARRPLGRELLESAVNSESLPIPCVSTEGIIGLKIQAYKNSPKRILRDQADIQALIEANDSDLDWVRLKEYADLFGEWEVLLDLKRRASE